jgi:hypothetical protein
MICDYLSTRDTISRGMTISFENDNDIIVYSLEKIISYAKDNQYIFLAQSVWWISSIIGLQQGLIVHIDNLKERTDIALRNILKTENSPNVNIRRVKIVSPTRRDIQENPRPYDGNDRIHPDRIHQVGKKTLSLDSEEECDSEPNQQSCVLQEAEQFLQISRKDRKGFNKQKANDQLSQMQSGKIIAIPLSNNQRQYLQSIPKDTIVE